MRPKKKSSKKVKSRQGVSRSRVLSPKTERSPPASNAGKTAHIIRKRRLYSPDALQAAFNAVKDSNISVNAASKQYGVPLTTLRDRVDGRIKMGATRPGPPQLMAQDEEAEIAHFLHSMARYGYRYTRIAIAEIATDQAVEKGKKPPKSNSLTTKWVDCFINRWPGVRELSSKFKDKTEAEHTVRTYFDEIKRIIDRHKLLEKNNRIFNIMEVNLFTDHSFCPDGENYQTDNFKTENVSNTTMILCGSVTGHMLPPYFVFQSARIRPEMLRGSPRNVGAAVSDTGKCTPQIFRKYLNEHFILHCPRPDDDPMLLLMDGNISHLFVGMYEWGRHNNIYMSFIPAHTTHLLQPLEVGCSETLQKKYESLCKRHLRTLKTSCISRNSICEIACQAFLRTMTRQVVMNSFKKAGVFPDVSSDESDGDSGNNELIYSKCSFSDKGSNEGSKDEVVFTDDLVVGHNQEVTEEEVVTTHEVILGEDGRPEEVVITPDGHLLLGTGAETVISEDGHLIIKEEDIFIADDDDEGGGLTSIHLLPQDSSQVVKAITGSGTSMSLSPVKLEPLIAESLPDSKCIINNGRIFSSGRLNRPSSSSSFVLGGDSSLNSSSDCDFSRDTSGILMDALNVSPMNSIVKTDLDFDVQHK